MIRDPKGFAARQVYEIFMRAGALLENGHFVYTSGRHGRTYLNHKALMVDPMRLSTLCSILANIVVTSSQSAADVKFDAVLGPATGGIPISQWLVYHLNRSWKWEAASLFAEKSMNQEGNAFALAFAFEKFVRDKKIFLVDDVVTTGGTCTALKRMCESKGGRVVGIGCFWNRGGVTSEDVGGIPIFSLREEKHEDWDPRDCPLCKNGDPVDLFYGHGK